MEDKQLIINEIKRVAKLLGREDISRDEFLQNSDLITRKDIERNFGGWAKAFENAGFQPVKYDSISDEELFIEYAKVKKKIGHYPLGALGEKEINDNSKYSGATYKRRYKGGLKKFAIEYAKWENIQGQTITTEEKIIKKVKDIESKQYLEISKNFRGKAAEYLVVAELLSRGYNTQILPVDEGLDIMAVKDNDLLFIQVKHSNYRKQSQSEVICITTSSFLKHQKSNVFYILVLLRKEPSQRDFLILPSQRINELIKSNLIDYKDDAKRITLRILHTQPENAYINKVAEKTDVSVYLNAWDVLT